VQLKLKSILKTLIFTLGVDFSIAVAAPEGGEVTRGDATINSTDPRNLQINQSSNKAIIKWQSFNVGSDESVNFHTPDASAITLNRITSGDASQILGHVSSNGQLWLINPNGILFGQGAQVNVAGLLASTMDITDENFLNSNYVFSQSSSNLASIINQGNINATNGGYVAMLAPQINNTGIISAELGTVAMVAGNQATLTFQNNHLLNIAVPSNVPLYDGTGKPMTLTNSGTIQADGGQVLLTAAGMNELLDESINVTGIIKADTVSESQGKIILSASGNTILDNATISAQGGSVEVLGQHEVKLLDNTSINAGGGQIYVGWDQDDPSAIEAQATVIAPNVYLTADSVETSGDKIQEDLSHIFAKHLLIDPWDVTIASSGSDIPDDGNFDPSSTSTITASSIDTVLNNGTDVTITTGSSGTDAGNITINNDVTWSSGNTLTLNAANNIILNNNITNTSTANLNLEANGTVSGAGNINLASGSVNVAGTDGIGSAGATTLNSTQALQLGNISSADLTVTAQDVTQNAVITTAGANVTMEINDTFNQSPDGSIVTGSGLTWGNVTIHAGIGASGITGLMTSAGLIEGNSLCIDTGANSTSAFTQSGSWISHDTGSTGMSILNYGMGDIIQTSTGHMTLTFADSPTTDLGISLTAMNGGIVQAGTLDAKQSLVTLKAEVGDHITQDDGEGHLGSITSGTTKIFGTDGATANLSGNNSLGKLGGYTLGHLTVNDVNTNGLTLDTITLSGNLTIVAQSIAQSDGIQMTGMDKTASFIVANGGTVNLDNHNQFNANTVSVVGAEGTAAGTVTIHDASTLKDLMLGTVLSNSLTITEPYAIHLTGAVNVGSGTVSLTTTNGGITDDSGSGYIVAGTTTLTQGGLGNIDFENTTSNSFGTITASATGVSLETGDGIVLNDSNSNGLTIAGLTTGLNGNISVIENGSVASGPAITLASAINPGSGSVTLEALGGGGIIEANNGSITTSSSTTLQASGGNTGYIDLEGDNSFTAVAATSDGGAITLNDVNTSGITLNEIDSADNFTLTASGAITQSSDVNAGTHTVNLTTTDTGITTGNNAIYLSDGTLTAGDVNMTTASGAIYQDFGLINSTGTLTIAASNGAHDGGNSVNLSNPTNQLGTVNISHVNDVTLYGENGYTISGISSTGDIYAETNYGVDDPVTTGTLEVSGAVTTSKPTGTINLSNTRTTAEYGVQVDSSGSLSAPSDIDVSTAESAAGFTNNGINIAGNISSPSGNIYIYDNRNYELSPNTPYAANMNIAGTLATDSGNLMLEDFGAGLITIADGASLHGGTSTPLVIQSDNGSITQSGGTIAGAAGVNVTASGNIIQGGTVTTAGSAIDILAGEDFTQTETGTLTAGSGSNWGNVTLSANGNSGGSTGALTQAGTVEGNDLLLTASVAGGAGTLLQNGSLISHDASSGTPGIQLYESNDGLDLTQSETGLMTTSGSDVWLGNNSAVDGETITQAGSINTNGGDVEFGLSSTGTITQNSTGNIVAKQVELFFQNNATVDLTGANNAFGALAVDNTNSDVPTMPIATALNVADQGNLAFGLFYNDPTHPPSSPDSFSSLSINTTGNITQLTSDDDGDALEPLTVTGATTLNANAGDITLNGDSQLDGAVSASGHDVALSNSGALILAAGTVSGILQVFADGAITQSGALTVTGDSVFDAGGEAITLDNTGNDFGGTVVVGHEGATSSGDMTLAADSHGITVHQASNNLSSLAINSAGDINEAGILRVTGNTNLSAGGLIDFSNPHNDFNSLAITHGGNNVTINDQTAVVLGTSNVSGDLVVTAGGAVTQSGALNATGATTITTPDDITLNGANHLDGVVTLNGNNINVDNIDATELGNVTASGNLSGTFFGAVTQAPDAALTVTGTSNINAESNDVSLLNSDNQFGGAVSITGNNLSLVQNGSLDLGTIFASGNVILSATQLNNTTGANAITTGTGDAWEIYLTNLAGNTFGNLASGNQAIWGTSYPTAIKQTGNRYIFGTAESLTLAPDATPFSVSKTQGQVATLPTPIAGTNYQATGFVDASQYDNAFTRDTMNNVAISGVSYASDGVPVPAPIGIYPVEMTGTASVVNGYTASYDPTAEFGELTVDVAPTSLIPAVPPNNSYYTNPSLAGSGVETSAAFFEGNAILGPNSPLQLSMQLFLDSLQTFQNEEDTEDNT